MSPAGWAEVGIDTEVDLEPTRTAPIGGRRDHVGTVHALAALLGERAVGGLRCCGPCTPTPRSAWWPASRPEPTWPDAIARYLDVVLDGRVDLTPMLTHLRPLSDWRNAFDLLADQAASGAVKVAFDQR